jgi:PPM family protein phosphatase
VLESFGHSDVGRRRSLNEDACLVDAESSFFAICDGMGGQNAGEVASHLAMEALFSFIEKSHDDEHITWPYGIALELGFDGNRLHTGIGLANKRVFRAADERPDYAGMGTTVVAALVRGAELTLAWVGDSRAYLIRGGAAEMLTRDHTWVNMALDQGILAPEEAEKHPWSHVLVRALGARDTVEAEILERRLEPGDMVLLCSDGLTGMLTDDEIVGLLTPPPPLEDGVETLIAAANEAGGKDNVSVILLRYAGD